MPKAPSSAVGIDLGRHAFKAVHLQRKGSGAHARPVLTAFATRVVGNNGATPGTAEEDMSVDTLAHHLKLLLRDLGVTGKACAVAASGAGGILRLIEQPPTPPRLLRDALRLNGLALLNQDCRDFVLDCDEVSAPDESTAPGARRRYLVGGLPRAQVNRVSEALNKSRVHADRVGLAPIANYNAFGRAFELESGHAGDEAFLLVDIGHEETRVLAGTSRELVLVRSVDYGGRHFLDAVSGDGAIDRDAAVTLVEQGDAGMAEAGHASLAGLARELRSSIGFFEGQREQAIRRVFFSGALVKAEMPLQILSDELEMPCDTWDPFAGCDVHMPKNRLARFDAERAHLNVACGAALEMLQPAAV